MTVTRMPTPAQKWLAEYVHLLRPDWDIPGIRSAITAAAATGAGEFTIGRRALAVAANPALRTPALIGQPGPIAGEHDTPPLPHTIATRCAEHPTQDAATCRACIPAAVTARPWRDTFALTNGDPA